MFSQFSRAIVRPPARNFADGLTTVDLGVPDVDIALTQHAEYCRALTAHGCEVIVLPADDRYPDSTFVEDTALILPQLGAIRTRPGAESRLGEVESIVEALLPYFPALASIAAPGTLDAGDVCEAGHHVFIGLSYRTNEHGAAQLTEWLAQFGYSASTVDIRGIESILHLKSGIAAIDPQRLVLIDTLADHPAFAGYDIVRVPLGEEYGANCVRVNDVVFTAAGQPKLDAALMSLGYTLQVLDMSEYRKMDGGLSCLSLRF
jgi:dimethylargininase